MSEDLSFELKRQTLHVVLGVLILILALVNRTFILWLLFFLLLFCVFLSLLHLKFRFSFLLSLLEKFERKEYRKKFPLKGAIFFLAGSLLTLKIFSLDIALASIVILTFSDSVSHIIGKLGNRKNPLTLKKNIEGSIAGIIAGTIAASFFVPLFFAFLASFIAMLAEALSFKLQEEEVDDNVVIPLVAGTVIFLLQKFV